MFVLVSLSLSVNAEILNIDLFSPFVLLYMKLSMVLKSHSSLHRSEIDRLMALLCNRAVDNPVQVEERTPDVLHSRSGVFHEQIEEVAKTPLQENGNGGHLIHSKAINSSVGKLALFFSVWFS